MDFMELQSFIAVYDCQNITEAARRLYVTQPALSRRIRDMERELGIPLFVRKSKGIEITEAARLLYPDALRMLSRKQQIQARALHLLRAEEGELRIGVGLFFPRTPLMRAIAAMAESHPGVSLSFTMNAVDGVHQLGTGELDLVLVSSIRLHPVQDWPHLVLQTGIPSVLVGATHRFWNRKSLSFRDLAEETIAVYSGYSPSSQAALDLMVRKACPSARCDFSCHSMEDCLFHAAGGHAVALCDSISWAELSDRPSAVRNIPLTDLPGDLVSPSVVYQEESSFALAFTEHLKRFFPVKPKQEA